MTDQISSSLQKHYSEQLNYGNDTMLEESRKVNKTLLTLSAGAIVLSITFCTSIKGPIGYPVLVGASWVSLIFCLIFDLLSMHLNNLKLKEVQSVCQMEYAVSHNPDELRALSQDKTYNDHRVQLAQLATRSNFYSGASIVLLVVGISLLAIFAFYYIYHY